MREILGGDPLGLRSGDEMAEPHLGRRYRAVLFDMDGVITDSMPHHYEAWRRIFATFDIPVTREEIFAREGEKGEVTVRAVLARHGIHPTEQELGELLREKEELFRSFASVPRLFPGAEECVRALYDLGKKLALVTGTSSAELRSNLPRTLLPLFHAIVSGDMVTRGKPEPEPYVTALGRLGVGPSEAVVVENAPYGIRSAKAAGLYCIALTTSLPPPFLAEADLILEDMHAVRKVLCEPSG